MNFRFRTHDILKSPLVLSSRKPTTLAIILKYFINKHTRKRQAVFCLSLYRRTMWMFLPFQFTIFRIFFFQRLFFLFFLHNFFHISLFSIAAFASTRLNSSTHAANPLIDETNCTGSRRNFSHHDPTFAVRGENEKDKKNRIKFVC